MTSSLGCRFRESARFCGGTLHGEIGALHWVFQSELVFGSLCWVRDAPRKLWRREERTNMSNLVRSRVKRLASLPAQTLPVQNNYSPVVGEISALGSGSFPPALSGYGSIRW